MEIDIRYNHTMEVHKIIFSAGKTLDRSIKSPETELLICVNISGSQLNQKVVNIKESEIDNLIEALKKAKELWFTS